MNPAPLERAKLFGERLRQWLPQGNSKQDFVVSDSMISLLSEEATERADAKKLLESVRDSGRLILHGAPGSGKTTALCHLYLSAISDEILPIYFNLSYANDWIVKEWNHATVHVRVQHLLSNISQPSLGEAEILATSTPILLLLDGIDVLGAAVGDSLIEIASHLAFRWPQTCVIVADRYCVRDFGYERWMHASLRTDREPEPHQRDAHTQAPELTVGLASTIGTEQYVASGWRQLSLKSLSALNRGAPAESGDSMELVAGSMMPRPWLVDRAVARAVASETFWNKHSFDRLSLGGTYFEVLTLLCERLEPDLAERFVRQAYEWNFYSAVYVLRTSEPHEPANISNELSTALLCTVADRLWDRFESTVEAARVALLVVRTDTARQLLAGATRASIAQHAAQIESTTPWFVEWSAWFLQPTDWIPAPEQAQAITGDDALLTWAASNALRRASLPDACLQSLHAALNNSDDMVRWRSAHALARSPSAETAALLAVRARQDSFRWVARTALRSLMEMLASALERQDDKLATGLSSTIQDLLAGQSTLQSPLVKEFERCAVLAAAPPRGWADVIGPLLRSLFSLIRSPDDTKRLELLTDRLRPKTASDA